MVLQRYEYDAFGAVTVQDASGNSANGLPLTNYLFTGREYQPENGLYNYRNRFYHPELGRFLQTDPLGYFDSLNLYQYGFNNPNTWVDAYGLSALSLLPEMSFETTDSPYEDLGQFYPELWEEYLKSLQPEIEDDRCTNNVLVPREPSTFNQFLWGLGFLGVGAAGFRGPEFGAWGAGQSYSGWHFHLGTKLPGLGKHHLPQQTLNWLKNLKGLLK